MCTLRTPTPAEREELAQYLAARGEDYYQAVYFVAAAAIAVFDGYASDGPGYSGRVMVVVWSGGPSLYEAFIWRSGKLVHQDTEIGPYHDKHSSHR